jgi:hypothetical protein
MARKSKLLAADIRAARRLYHAVGEDELLRLVKAASPRHGPKGATYRTDDVMLYTIEVYYRMLRAQDPKMRRRTAIGKFIDEGGLPSLGIPSGTKTRKSIVDRLAAKLEASGYDKQVLPIPDVDRSQVQRLIQFLNTYFEQISNAT